MMELVVISGKGGTGKTTLAASIVALAGRAVAADCDVDAANLHLVTPHEVIRREPFTAGKVAVVDPDICTGCGKCFEVCRYSAVQIDTGKARIDKMACEGCGVCAYFCPAGAAVMVDRDGGEWFVSKARTGPLIHARLAAGSENSGKLVTIVRNQARNAAEEAGIDLVVIDGAPGIGCPVISSLSGADAALVVTEPTLSGLHDLDRVLGLTRHFSIAAIVAVNRADINEDLAGEIRRLTESAGAGWAGEIRYDPDVGAAQAAGISVVEYSNGPAAADIGRIWERVRQRLGLEVT
jgi:MinD superfamily P-loop ATPase